MKNLLITFLLAIFTLQATIVAVDEHVVATVKLEQMYANAAIHAQDPVETDEDGLKASWAIEEMSDYLPAGLVIPRSNFTAPAAEPAQQALLSIDLPRIKPPPRG